MVLSVVESSLEYALRLVRKLYRPTYLHQTLNIDIGKTKETTFGYWGRTLSFTEMTRQTTGKRYVAVVYSSALS